MKFLTVLVYLVVIFVDVGIAQEQVCQDEKDLCMLSDRESVPSDRIVEEVSSVLELNNKKVNVSMKFGYVPTINKSDYVDRENIVDYTISKILSKTTLNGSDSGYRSPIEREYISALSSRLLSFSQPFDASLSPTASEECRKQSKFFIDSVKNFDFWALKMHDSSARLSSGILNGNINQFGDFDQCLSVEGPMENLNGQYCLAYLQANIDNRAPHLKKIHDLVQSHGAFKSEFNDPGHRVPRFSLINWALCVPSACTPLDVENSLKNYIKNFTSNTGISFQIRVEPRMCQTSVEQTLDRNTKLAAGFFLCIIAICILSTAYEYFIRREEQNEWFVAFSLWKNTRRLFDTKASPGDIGTVHGIRCFNALMLLVSHKSMAVFFNPYVNRTAMTETLGKPWTVVGRAASIYTDPFLLFSGMLTAYSLFGRLQKGQSVRLRSEYVGRLLRIVPTLGALILFCTYILPLLSSGPQWNLVVRHHSDICKKHWWRNLLFIHNYFGFSNMCLTHTHHLGIDTELFAFAPLAILGLWKWPRKGLTVLLGIAALSTAARFHTTVINRLSNYVYFGTTIQRLFKTADYMYSFPPHRSTVYILGVLLGYGLRMCKDMKLNNSQLRWGWFASIALFFAALLGPAPMGDMNYKYNPFHAAYYAAFAPIAWCGFFAWIVFTSHLGYQNRFTDILSWKGFQITTKLSYAIYLTQFPVFFFNVGRKRSADYYSFLPMMIDINEFISIIASSVVLTLLFDSPFQNIKKLIFKNPSPIKSSSARTTPSSAKHLENELTNETAKDIHPEKHIKML